MRFSQLEIQTQRSAPADLRTEGLAFLYRAGYLSRSGEPQSLGRLVIERLHKGNPVELPGFFSGLGLTTAFCAETGQYFALLENGSDELLLCPACAYAARRDLARARREPFSTEQPLPLEKLLTPECSTIAQLALFLDIPQQKTAKALMFTRIQDGRFVFVVVRGDLQMSESKLRACVGEVRLATPQEVEASGAVAGYASPLGLRDALVVVDDLVARSPNLVAGANEHGYHLKNTNMPRDYQAGLVADVTLASAGDLCPDCAAPLTSRRGTLLSTQTGLRYEDLLIVLAEVHHDEKGLTLPAAVAPFDIYLMNIPGKTLDTASAAQDIYNQLTQHGLAVLFDDRDERAGVKFNDADLIGCPMRVAVGERALQNGQVELKRRRETENRQVSIDDLLSGIYPG